eukprot:COSAG02_NODE_288_length_25612_cov_29.808529_10_plen_52_part_00
MVLMELMTAVAAAVAAATAVTSNVAEVGATPTSGDELNTQAVVLSHWSSPV